jgi:hypothetical protein
MTFERGMRENYNGFNFFVRILGSKMGVWKDFAGANGLSDLCQPSTGLWERKAPQSRGMWALRDAGLYHPSTGLWERKPPQSRGMWAQGDSSE